MLQHVKDRHAMLFLGAISTLAHLAPFWLWGADPLGYDTGFYRRYLLEPFSSFPNPPVPGLGADALLPRAALDILRMLHVPTDSALYGLYITCTALLPIAAYFFLAPKLGRRGALIAGVLMVFSPLLYNAYWYFLLKNFFALPLILFAFAALERQKLWWALPLSAAVALSHKTSAIIYLLSLAILLVIKRAWWRNIIFCGAVTGILFLLANVSLVHQVSLALPSAVFLEWRDAVGLWAPFILLIALGWRGLLRPLPPTLLALTIASFLFPILHLPFYERIFVYCDVALAMLATVGADYALTGIDFDTALGWVRFSALCISFGLVLGIFFNQVITLSPLMGPSDISAIARAGAQLPQGAYLLTTADEAPWYEGWTTAHIIAPGLLHDTHNFEAWSALWDATSSEATERFLASYGAPLYISTLGHLGDLIGHVPPCLANVGPDLYLSECE